MDYVENVVQLIAIIISLLISVFGYIEAKSRKIFLVVVFAIANLFSCYFWTTYLVIMGETPEISDAFAYFGWNVAMAAVLVLLFRIYYQKKSIFFYGWTALFIPLNVCQLLLYLQFGGFWNNLYQVGVGTMIMILSVNLLVDYLKHKSSEQFPFIVCASLMYICSEFAMWTASCFGGFIGHLYYLFSFVCSLSYILVAMAANRNRIIDVDDNNLSDDTPVICLTADAIVGAR